jgi:hypothetical protein
MTKVVLNSASGDRYLYAGAYESYIENQINNQERLARYLHNNGVISESAASEIIAVNEAKLSDNIKAKWNKFLAFIKGVMSKFMESMSNLLLNEKSYLEKYEDIIKKKVAKEDMEYSYTGDYKEGINRLITTECPIFNYEKHAEALRKDGYADVLKIIMSGKNFTYDESETLANQFKSYYIVYDHGLNKGKFSDLNMTDLYNFCYNFKKIEDIVKKDENHLNQSTSQIVAAIQKELRERGEKTADVNVEKQPEGQTVKSGGSDTSTPKTDGQATQGQSSGGNGEQHIQPTQVDTKESYSDLYGSYFIEDGEKVKVGTGLNITNTSATSQMGSYSTDDAKNPDDATKQSNAKAAAADSTSTEKDIDKIANKWIAVCKPLITAKLTACEQIAKDYMTIIRAHVRSYVGNADNTADDKSADKATSYSKNAAQTNKEANNTETQQAEQKSGSENTPAGNADQAQQASSGNAQQQTSGKQKKKFFNRKK